MMVRDLALFLAALALVPASWGCESDGGAPAPCGQGEACQTQLAIAGSYTDGWGGFHELSEGLWTQGGFGNPSFFHVEHFSNEVRVVVARNDGHNAWSAGLWSRFDWTWYDAGDGEALYYCQTSYDAESEEAALAVPAADPADPASGGCGGVAWSLLTPGEPQLILMGDWADDWGTSYTIDAEAWVQSWDGTPESTYAFEINDFSLAGQWLLARNASDNPTGADLWSRFDWTWFEVEEGPELWFCQSVYDAASEEAASAAPRADESDPASGGCGVAAWSRLLPVAEPSDE